MTYYRFRAKTDVNVSESATLTLAEAVRGRRVGVVSTHTVLTLKACRDLMAAARDAAVALDVLGVAQANPTVEDADGCLTLARRLQCDVILAIGGGSAMDAAKAVRAGLETGRSVADLFAGGMPAGVPAGERTSLVVVPSAFGTGAETSAGAILTRRADGTKGGIRGAAIPPDMAIVHTALARSLPRTRTVEIAFDALTHAIETYLSRAASPVTDVLALDVIERLPRLLIELADREPSDVQLLDIARCSFLMGYNLANSSTCLPHRMQYAVASIATASHQRDLAALYPAWLSALEGRRVERLSRSLSDVRKALSTAGIGVSAEASASETFSLFLQRIGLHTQLSALGLSLEDLPTLTARTTGNTGLDPLQPSPSVISGIFLHALTHAE